MRLPLVLIVLVLLLPVQAQSQPVFNCDEQSQYQTQLSMNLPEIGTNASQVIVSALGRDEFQPVMHIQSGDVVYCAAGSAYYALSHAGETRFGAEASSTQEIVAIPGSTQVDLGNLQNQPGSFYVVLESAFEPSTSGDHRYSLHISPEIAAHQQVMEVYLFASQPDLRPAFEIEHAEQTLSAAMLDDATLDSPPGLLQGAAYLALAPQQGELAITVKRRADMLYVLVISVMTGTPSRGDGAANAVFHDDGSVSLRCDDALIFENGVRVDLPDDDMSYSLSLFGSGNPDPVLAIVDASGAGTCYDQQQATFTMRAQLPSVTVNGSNSSALGVASAQERTVVIGGHDSAAGSYLLLIEGGYLLADEAAVFRVTISPGMVSAYNYLTLYAVATDDQLDTALVLLDADGVALSTVDGTMLCDNAGTDSCPFNTVSLRGSFLPLVDGTQIAALELDAMLAFAVDPEWQGIPLAARVSSAAEGGRYVLALHIVTD